MAFQELFDDPLLERFRRPYAIAVHRYLPRSNVLGISVGPRTRGDRIDWEDIVLRVRVKEKKDPDRLGDDVIPAVIDGVETDIIEGTGSFQADRGSPLPLGRTDPCRTDRCDPLVPGVSIGVDDHSAGTLGMFVRHQGDLCILTADHVIAPNDNGRNRLVYQPSPKDDPNRRNNLIGSTYERFSYSGVALVRCDTKRKIENVPVGANERLHGTRWPQIGDILKKSGRSTGIIYAKVCALSNPCWNCTPGFELKPVDDRTSEISMGGDSGSIWYDPETYEAIGVHCCGDADCDSSKERAGAAMLCHLACYLNLTFDIY